MKLFWIGLCLLALAVADPAVSCLKFKQMSGCNRMWAPVCATNVKTYGNLCMLCKEKEEHPEVSVLHGGECTQDEIDEAAAEAQSTDAPVVLPSFMNNIIVTKFMKSVPGATGLTEKFLKLVPKGAPGAEIEEKEEKGKGKESGAGGFGGMMDWQKFIPKQGGEKGKGKGKESGAGGFGGMMDWQKFIPKMGGEKGKGKGKESGAGGFGGMMDWQKFIPKQGGDKPAEKGIEKRSDVAPAAGAGAGGMMDWQQFMPPKGGAGGFQKYMKMNPWTA